MMFEPPGSLSVEHMQHLKASAVDVELALEHGVYSVMNGNLPEQFASYGEVVTPGIIFPWHQPGSNLVVPQLKPDVPFVGSDGRKRKYLWPTGQTNVLDNLVGNGSGHDTLVLCEGAKKALAVASYRSPGLGVVGMVGAWSFLSSGAPIPDLEIVERARVIVIFDADLTTNPDVHEAAKRIEPTLRLFGAADVRFAINYGGSGKAGIDDVLASIPERMRANALSTIISNAVPVSKLGARPKPRKQEATPAEPEDDRPVVDVSKDRFFVTNRITDVLKDRWDGDRLFDHGNVISQRRGHVMDPLDKGTFHDIVGETMVTGQTAGDAWIFGWPDPGTGAAVLSRARDFSPLNAIARMPFVRADGTICSTPGYDTDSHTFVVLEPELVGLQISAWPTSQDVASARRLLVEEWLGDMPFPDEASRANALALVLTPFIRGLVPIVPLAVIDGLQASVGKNLLADCLCILATGHEAKPLPWAGDEEEQRKALTSAFMTGADIFVFDEAHVIHGRALAQVLTAATWQDRILGVSKMGNWPNRITWVSLGNQVQLQGDLFRRVYRIRLHPTGANPENRPDTSFRHPDLRGWTHEHRAELLTAALTLVQAWQVAGKPRPTAEVNFGSFEQWQKIVGGILEVAGQTGFLENTTTWRSDSDHDRKQWLLHLAWLHDTFGETEFTSREARSKMVVDSDVEPPPIDSGHKSTAQQLGKAYFTISDRWIDGYQLLRKDMGHTSVRKWQVIKADGGGSPDPVQPPREDIPVERIKAREAELRLKYDSKIGRYVAPTVGTLVFDLETADAKELWSYGPGFVRLIGCSVDSGPVVMHPTPATAIDLINAAGLIVGHNIMGFDLIALARYHGLDIHRLVREDRVFDTKLVAFLADPPTERLKAGQIEKAYSLQTLTGAKTGDIKKLAKQHGGFDQIPIEDPEFVEYLEGDVRATETLMLQLPEFTAYTRREHRVAALAAQISLNGFRVDVPLLGERLAEGKARKAEGLAKLTESYDLPTTNKAGKPVKSPQATEAGKEAIRKAFQDLGVELPRTEHDAPALGKESLDSVIEDNPNHPEVIELAELVKGLNGERTVYQTVADHLVLDRVHPQVDMRQVSGRWSITKPGLTVMGKRGGKHVERNIFLPEEGEVIIAVDLSQVDARAIAAHCQDPAYIALFEPGRDLHSEVAERVWGDAGRREDAKVLAHGWNYGMGIRGLARNAKVSEDVAIQFDTMMSESFPRLVEWREEVRHIAEAGVLLDNGFGRMMRPNPDRSWTQGPALMGQGTARDIMMEGLLRLPDELLPGLRAVVHDEVVLSVRKSDAEEAAEAVITALSFSWAPPWAMLQVPIVAGLAGPPASSWGAVYSK